MDDRMRQQIIAQCNVVVHLATAMARLHADYAKMFQENAPAMDDIADQVGRRSADIMESLGDTLSNMDAVTEEDEWTAPIFEAAHQMWPQEAR